MSQLAAQISLELQISSEYEEQAQVPIIITQSSWHKLTEHLAAILLAILMWVGAFRRIDLQKPSHKHKNWNEEPHTRQKLGLLLPLVSRIVLSFDLWLIMSGAGAYQKDLLASGQCCAEPSRHYRQSQPTRTHSSFYFEEVLVQATLNPPPPEYILA